MLNSKLGSGYFGPHALKRSFQRAEILCRQTGKFTGRGRRRRFVLLGVQIYDQCGRDLVQQSGNLRNTAREVMDSRPQ